MVDIEYLKRKYFYFDDPVPYKSNNNQIIFIYPISLRDSEFFLSSKEVLEIDKNSLPDVKIIQMTYLEFLCKVVLQEEEQRQKLLNILILCLKFNNPIIVYDEKNKPFLIDKEKEIIINSKDFDEIKRIILYQNLIDYDDEYVNPELQQKIDEDKMLKMRNVDFPSLERKMSIITAHTGILKKDQLEMTYRTHSSLFQEVYEETEYNTLYPVAAFTGQSDKVSKWIYRMKKNKFEDQVVSVSNFNKQAGGTGEVGQKIVNK